jgi:hypothetical protein
VNFAEVKGEMPQGKLKVKTNAKPPQKKNKPPKVTWLITVPYNVSDLPTINMPEPFIQK